MRTGQGRAQRWDVVRGMGWGQDMDGNKAGDRHKRWDRDGKGRGMGMVVVTQTHRVSSIPTSGSGFVGEELGGSMCWGWVQNQGAPLAADGSGGLGTGSRG